MKLMNTLLTTTALVIAASAVSANPFTGTFVGAKIGTSKAASKKADSAVETGGTAIAITNGKKSAKFGATGGVLVGHRATVAQDVILGVSLGVDLESTKATSKATATYSAGDKYLAKSKVQRQYTVNLLGQAGYNVSKDVLVFANDRQTCVWWLLFHNNSVRYRCYDCNNPSRRLLILWLVLRITCPKSCMFPSPFL